LVGSNTHSAADSRIRTFEYSSALRRTSESEE